MEATYKVEIVTEAGMKSCEAKEYEQLAIFINTNCGLQGSILAWNETKVRRYIVAARNDRKATYWLDAYTLLRFYKAR